MVYASALKGDPCQPNPASVVLDNATIDADVPAARLQLERAGLRLAKELDLAFKR